MSKPAAWKVDLTGSGDAKNLLGYITASPLDELMNASLDDLDLAGNTRIRGTVGIQPEIHGNRVLVDGIVDLLEISLTEAQWGIELEQLSGQLIYTHEGISATQLSALHAAKPVQIALNAGPGFAGENVFGKQKQGHVWSAVRPVNGEESQAGGGQSEQRRISMRH